MRTSLPTASPRPLLRASALLLITPALSGCADRLQFGSPLALIALALVALVVIWWKRVAGPRFAFSRVADVATLRPSWRIRLRWLPNALRLVALVSAVLALARPQLRDFAEDNVEGIDIMLALDMSGSMAAVDMTSTEIRRYQRQEGIDPPGRFDHAIRTLKRFVDARTRDRIGMVVFARNAYLQFPLTLDYATIQTLLDRLELNDINSSSTAIGNAVGLAVRGLMDSSAESRAVIVITDGKQQGGNISPVAAAEIARDEGIRIYSILVGSGEETMAPIDDPFTRLSRYVPENYPIDPDLLQEIAELSGGEFYRATEPQQLDEGLNRILDELETTRIEDISSVNALELYPYFGLACLGFLLLAALGDYTLLRRYP